MKFLFLLLSLSLLLTACISEEEKILKPGKYDTFVTCVTASGAEFYGTEWCPHCQRQKALFGNSMSKINHIDCDKNSSLCKKKNITGYPTWILGDGKRLEGTQSLSELAKGTGCQLTEDKI